MGDVGSPPQGTRLNQTTLGRWAGLSDRKMGNEALYQAHLLPRYEATYAAHPRHLDYVRAYIAAYYA